MDAKFGAWGNLDQEREPGDGFIQSRLCRLANCRLAATQNHLRRSSNHGFGQLVSCHTTNRTYHIQTSTATPGSKVSFGTSASTANTSFLSFVFEEASNIIVFFASAYLVLVVLRHHDPLSRSNSIVSFRLHDSSPHLTLLSETFSASSTRRRNVLLECES